MLFRSALTVSLVRYMETNEGKGFAFVAFRSKDDVQKAIEELHNKDFKVWIIHSQSREKKAL
ncbi:putative RNA recognition motif domain, nucleotide-binding alpha-beta plait domain superfamily [Helianthus annuus]|uniref:Putative nucleotide-binding alpha-beta plait domain-containing protein n=1 Tax=Helianthus annuus TaxID=4232 RepID=A0A251U6X3_HELAN|nr:putative RNA recognition motif domain, nucleotide-binding alpha-beta plait domain superfamily [Helianthus annuus]KAJ0924051.1 putative RNA recognition motif domain, nucleotide-binding alpha-beta plait domain superfamily [Helianthus annuus]